MVDPITYSLDTEDKQRVRLEETAAHPSAPFKICSCSQCEELIYRHAVKPKFSGYSRASPINVEELTEHQYFICDRVVESFIFKMRSWREIDPSHTYIIQNHMLTRNLF